jgi:hypothetical protein
VQTEFSEFYDTSASAGLLTRSGFRRTQARWGELSSPLAAFESRKQIRAIWRAQSRASVVQATIKAVITASDAMPETAAVRSTAVWTGLSYSTIRSEEVVRVSQQSAECRRTPPGQGRATCANADKSSLA